ncbi:MAG: hypothetical protein F4X97_05060 [Boseongicola sp. SB0662_bin_57]|nr:hypothetical protein [Boseongicola sp. SB0662_bin_57]
MPGESVEELLAYAEDRYRLKIFDNYCEQTVKAMAMPDRLRLVGGALMERTDYQGFVLGRRLVAAASERDRAC